MTRDDLLKRLREATGADEELSARIVAATICPPGSYVKQSPLNGKWCTYYGSDRSGKARLFEFSSAQGLYRPEGWNVTESLDAAIGLVERMLPGRCWNILKSEVGGRHEAYIRFDYTDIGEAFAPTPALALLIALLEALNAQEQGKP